MFDALLNDDDFMAAEHALETGGLGGDQIGGLALDQPSQPPHGRK